MSWKTIKTNVLQGLTLLFFACFSLGQLQRWEVGPGVLYIHDVVALVFVIFWLFTNRWSVHVATPRVSPSIGISLCLTGWIVLGIVSNTSLTSSFLPFLYIVRLIFYAIFTYLITFKVSWPGQWEWPFKPAHFISLLFTVTGIGILYFGFLQYAFLPDTRFLQNLGWDDHYYRLISTLFDPAFTGAILVLTWTLAQYTMANVAHWLKNGLLFLLAIGIALTFSRASYAAFAISLICVLFFHIFHTRKPLSVPVASFFLFVFFIWLAPKPTGEGVNLLRTSTVAARQTNIMESLSLTPVQWITGRGMFVPLPELQTTEEREFVPDHAHVPDNLFVFLVSGLGIVGSVLLLMLVWLQRKWFLQLPWWAVASFSAVFVHSMFNNTLFQPFIWLWIMGIVWAVQWQKGQTTSGN